MQKIESTGRVPAVGVLGAGRMGAPIATTLGRSFPLRARDIDPRRADEVVGVSWCGSIEELTRDSDVLISILPGRSELQECMADVLAALRAAAASSTSTSTGSSTATTSRASRSTASSRSSTP